MSTFVSLGNATQPFNRLLDAVVAIVSMLPEPIVVQYGNTPFSNGEFTASPFLELSEFIRYIEDADLLILHAGAGSVIHAINAGKVPVVMPRRAKYGEIVDDHQLEFARALAEKGKVVIAEEPEQLADAVRRALKLQPGIRRDAGEAPLVRLVAETLAGYAGRSK